MAESLCIQNSKKMCSIDLEPDRHYRDLVGKSIRIIFIIIYRRTISRISLL